MTTNTIGDLIRNYRSEQGLSQMDLAERLHVRLPRVMSWESNRSVPTGKVRRSLALLMQIDEKNLSHEQIHQDMCEKAAASERIMILRKKAGLTQVQLAEYLHVGKTSVAMWETGERGPRLPEAYAMSKLFHCRMDYLLGYSIDDRYYDYDKELLL